MLHPLCLTVTWSWSPGSTGRCVARPSRCLNWMCTFHFGKCNPSHTHRCLEFLTHSVPGSLILVRFPHRLHDLWSYFSTTAKITILARVSKMVKFRHFGGYPRKWPKMHILGGPFWTPNSGYPICQKPVPGGTIVWWYPPNYLLFRYPVWPPKTLFLGPKHVDPPKPGVLGKPCFWHVFRTFC